MKPWVTYRVTFNPDMFWDAAVDAWVVDHPRDVRQTLQAADRFINPHKKHHQLTTDKVGELIENNQHREATILIADTMGDLWLLQRAQNMKYVLDRYGYIPPHHAEECAAVDREAHIHLQDPLFNVLGN